MRSSSRLAMLVGILIALATVTAAAQDMEWMEIKGPEGGGPVDLAFDTATGDLFAATMAGGIFTSTDDGLTWTGANGDLPALNPRRIVVGPGGSLFAFVGGVGYGRRYEGGLYRSTDHGASWSYADLPHRWHNHPAFCISPGGTLYTRDSAMFMSTDQGTTWQPTGPGGALPSWDDIAVDAHERIVCRANTVYNAVMIISKGAWKTVVFGSEPFMVIDLEAFGDQILAGTTKGVYRSSDGGENWTRMDAPGFNDKPIDNFRGREGEIFASSYKATIRSTDNGTTWSRYGVEGAAVQRIALRGRGAVVSGTYETLHRSTDDGITWATVTEGVNARSIWKMAVSPTGSMFAISRYDLAFFRSTDRGERWEPLDFQVRTTPAVLSNGHIIVGDDRKLHRSTDDGATWTAIAEPDLSGATWGLVKGLSEGYVLATAHLPDYLSVWLSDDYGSTWKMIGREAIRDFDFSASDAVMISPGDILIGSSSMSRNFLRYTLSDGKWSSAISTLGQWRVESMAIDRKGAIWIANPTGTGQGGGLYQSTDGGKGWRNRNGALSSYSEHTPLGISSIVVAPTGAIFAGTRWNYGTVFMSTDHGASWTEVYRDIRQVPVISMVVDSSGYIYVGTDGHGILRSRIAAPVTSAPMSRPAATNLIVETSPNPVTSSTLLRFPMQTAGRLTVTIHSLLGQHIATVYDGDHEAGTCELRWDASDLPAGIYLYRVKSDQGSASGELRVVR